MIPLRVFHAGSAVCLGERVRKAVLQLPQMRFHLGTDTHEQICHTVDQLDASLVRLHLMVRRVGSQVER